MSDPDAGAAFSVAFGAAGRFTAGFAGGGLFAEILLPLAGADESPAAVAGLALAAKDIVLAGAGSAAASFAVTSFAATSFAAASFPAAFTCATEAAPRRRCRSRWNPP